MKKIPKRMGILSLWPIFILAFFSLSGFAHPTKGNTLHGPPLQDQQQQYPITGTVTDNYGPLPGVHVLIKGTQTGTFTDKDGAFALTVQASNTLVFSYVGYKTLELSILGRNTVEVQLLQEATQLQEVEVNAGYYTVKERERTGSISRVTAEEIELQPIISPLEALQGRMAGVEVVHSSGIAGSAPIIRIRGQNSIRNTRDDNGNLPLYIVDGVPINSSPILSYNGFTNISGLDPLSTLSLSNIESVEILKDADATAIYGSRGANGVILISTKGNKGFERETTVDLRLYSGLGEVTKRLDLLNTEQYISLRKEAFKNDNVTPTTFNAADLLLWDQNRYTDWQKELFGGTATITDLNIGVAGGNENTSFRFGGSYHNAGTVFPGDSRYNKMTTNLNLNHYSKDKRFQINLFANYGINSNRLFDGSSFVSLALSLPPNAPALFNEDGNLNWENSTWTNPLGVLEMDSRSQANNLISNLGISYNIGHGITLKADMGYTYMENEEKVKKPIRAYDPAFWDRMAHTSSHSMTKRKTWIIEPQIIYNASSNFGNFDAILGTTFQQNDDRLLRISGRGYSNEQLIGNLAAADAVTVVSNESPIYKYNAVFGRIGYNWNRKYFINLTGRRDGSSRFGKDKRFANFGAIGAAWIFTEEIPFKNNRSILSFGKFRGSYGTTGSDQIGNYGYLDAYAPTPGPEGLYPTKLVNPDYSWESNKKLEAALALGFFDDRVNMDLSWYRNRSSNQLVGYQLPLITGFGSVQMNLPATVQNQGWEIEASSIIIRSKDFSWQTSFNMSFPKNELVSYPNIELSSYANQYRIGYPLDIALLYKFDGIDPETGLYRVIDYNEDGRLDNDDRIIIKNRNREYFGGLNNEFRYKGLSLSFLMEFVKQDGGNGYPTNPPGRNSNIIANQFNVWRQGSNETDNQIASQDFPAFISYLNALSSDLYIVDASFMRLKTLSLSYSLPKMLLQNINVNAWQVYIHTQNLFTITGYEGLDPQRPGSLELPALRSITLGTQIQF